MLRRIFNAPVARRAAVRVATAGVAGAGVYTAMSPGQRQAAGAAGSTFAGVGTALTWRSPPPPDYVWSDPNRASLNSVVETLSDHDGLYYNPAVRLVNYQMDRRGIELSSHCHDAIAQNCVGRSDGSVSIIDAHRNEAAGFYAVSDTRSASGGSNMAGAALHTTATAFLLAMTVTTPAPYDPSDGPADI